MIDLGGTCKEDFCGFDGDPLCFKHMNGYTEYIEDVEERQVRAYLTNKEYRVYKETGMPGYK